MMSPALSCKAGLSIEVNVTLAATVSSEAHAFMNLHIDLPYERFTEAVVRLAFHHSGTLVGPDAFSMPDICLQPSLSRHKHQTNSSVR